MVKAPKSKAVAKKTVSTNKKVVTGKKKFSLSPKQRLTLLIVIALTLAGAGYASFAAYQNYNANAWSCVDRTYRKGSTGACVKYIIAMANKKVKTGLTPGTNFGRNTETAVKKYQSAARIGADGVVGQVTWKALCSTASAYSMKEYKLAGCSKLFKNRKPGASTLKTSTTCTKNGYYWIEKNGRSPYCTSTRAKASTITDAEVCRGYKYSWVRSMTGGYYCK